MKTKNLRDVCLGSEQSEMDLLAASCRMQVMMNSTSSADDNEEVIIVEDEESTEK